MGALTLADEKMNYAPCSFLALLWSLLGNIWNNRSKFVVLSCLHLPPLTRPVIYYSSSPCSIDDFPVPFARDTKKQQNCCTFSMIYLWSGIVLAIISPATTVALHTSAHNWPNRPFGRASCSINTHNSTHRNGSLTRWKYSTTPFNPEKTTTNH